MDDEACYVDWGEGKVGKSSLSLSLPLSAFLPAFFSLCCSDIANDRRLKISSPPSLTKSPSTSSFTCPSSRSSQPRPYRTNGAP